LSKRPDHHKLRGEFVYASASKNLDYLQDSKLLDWNHGHELIVQCEFVY